MALVIAGNLAAKTGGTIYDKKIAESLRRLHWNVEVISIAELASLPGRVPAVIDGLAYADGADPIERNAARLRLIALVHLPLACEPGLGSREAARRRAIEVRALAAVRRVIVTGSRTIAWLEQMGVDRGRISVVEPGTEPTDESHAMTGAPERETDVRLLSVGALTPGKGHELLLRALARVPESRWTLRCAGSLTRHDETVDRVRAALNELRLDDRVTLLGEIDEAALRNEYRAADAFALATWRETYGMAVAEAVAHGLPVVSTDTGAIRDIAGRAGVIVAPGDERALTAALTRVIADPLERRTLAMAAREQRGRLPTWSDAARRMADILEAVTRE